MTCYAPTEDICTEISVEVNTRSIGDIQSDKNIMKPQYVGFHSDQGVGCEKHRKAVMITVPKYTKENHAFFYRFLNANEAKKLCHALDNLTEEDFLSGLILKMFTHLDQKEEIVFLPRESAVRFVDQYQQQREEVQEYIEEHIDYPIHEESRRQCNQSEIERANALVDDYYKPDLCDYPLDGIDMGTFLAAAYNNARTGGVGLQYYRKNHVMTPMEGRYILSEIDRVGAPPEIDFINGKSLKLYLIKTDTGYKIKTTEYWDYNDVPIAKIVDLARKGQYDRINGQGVLDAKNELSILQKHFGLTNLVIGDLQKHQAEKLMGNDIETHSESGYQIKIFGKGRLRGEIGCLIKPFTPEVMRGALRLI